MLPATVIVDGRVLPWKTAIGRGRLYSVVSCDYCNLRFALRLQGWHKSERCSSLVPAMKSLYIVAVAASLFATNRAWSADPSPVHSEPAPVVVPFSWTGFYAGLNAGVNVSQRTVRPSLYVTDPTSYYTPAIMAEYNPGSFGIDRTGFIGGGQIGFNYQINTWVLGVEADFMGSTLRGRGNASRTLGFDPITNEPSSIAITNRLQQNWLGTVRARIGYGFDRTLLYVTGGLAYGSVKSSSDMLLTDNLPSSRNYFNWAGQNAQTQLGYTIGAGVEYALSDQWIIRGEYLYYNLGNISSTMVGTTAAIGGTTEANTEAFAGVTRGAIAGSIVRAALSYKF
jgi:outer membrane immunogenic protein